MDAGYRRPDTGCQMPDAGCRMPAASGRAGLRPGQDAAPAQRRPTSGGAPPKAGGDARRSRADGEAPSEARGGACAPRIESVPRPRSDAAQSGRAGLRPGRSQLRWGETLSSPAPSRSAAGWTAPAQRALPPETRPPKAGGDARRSRADGEAPSEARGGACAPRLEPAPTPRSDAAQSGRAGLRPGRSHLRWGETPSSPAPSRSAAGKRQHPRGRAALRRGRVDGTGAAAPYPSRSEE